MVKSAAPILLLSALLALAGCVSNQPGRSQADDNAGYRWVGSGEPGNFGADYGFCRRTVDYAHRSQTGSTDTVGGMALPWDSSRAYTATTIGASAAPMNRYGISDREVTQCLKSRGWALQADAPEATAAPNAAENPGAPTPPTAGATSP